MGKLILEEETYAILGACFEVYKEMGPGFLEPVYQECLQIELMRQGIPFEAQRVVSLAYKNTPLGLRYKADLICFDKILLELKAVSELIDEHRSQLLNYLHAMRIEVGLLINFGHSPRLEHERFVLTL